MQRVAAITSMALILAGGTAWAGCEYPDEPTTPDASKATVEEMQAAIATFKEFSERLEEYRQCLEKDFKDLDEEAKTDERKTLFTSQFNGSVAREEHLAELLNEQIRAWKEANEKKDSNDKDSQTSNEKANSANMWVYVSRNTDMETINVSVDPAFDIDPMDLSVRIKAGGLSHEFGFLRAIYGDEGVVTSDAHFSPNLALASITGVSAAIGSFLSQRGLKCAQKDESSSSRLVFGCNFRTN